MARTRKPASTLANAAYERLRADLLACRLVPGQAIRINEASLVVNANPIAVREALSKLTAEGLVTAQAQKGFRAAPISEADLRDLTAARREIECICLRMAIEAGGAEWEAGVTAALHRLLRTPIHAAGDSRRNSDEWAEQHRLFHLALVDACESPLLLEFRTTLFAKSERYRRLSVPMAMFERDLDAEHKGIAEAALARNVTAVVNVMTRHLTATTEILLQNPASFDSAGGPASSAPCEGAPFGQNATGTKN